MKSTATGIIGVGNVEADCLASIVMHSTNLEIVIVDQRHERAGGVVADVRYGAAPTAPVVIQMAQSRA